MTLPLHSGAEGEQYQAARPGAARPELGQGGGVAVVLDDNREREPPPELGGELVPAGTDVDAQGHQLAVPRQPSCHRQPERRHLASPALGDIVALGHGRLELGRPLPEQPGSVVPPDPV